MKKALWIVMAAALAVAVVAASAQTEVLSANAVGYIKKTLPAGGKLVAMSIPLDSMTNTSLVFGETSVASEAPIGSEVFFWDEVLQVWSGGSKSFIGWAPGEGNKVLDPGVAFFMKGPSGGSAAEVTITGEVPADPSLPRVMSGSGALSAVGNPYPVDFTFGTSALASNATIGSEVFFWDEALQVWSGGSKSFIGWAPGEANKVVLAGEGFFMKEAATVTVWDAAKPYTWP